jgi:hypothetical protein
MNNHVVCVLEPHTCAESRHVIHIASDKDELQLLSSLNILDYIEFDILCNLSCLEERLFGYADLSWFSRHTYHVVGKYKNNRQYMIQHVYISSNMDSSFIVQDWNQLNGSNVAANIHMPSTRMLPLVSTNLLQNSIDQQRVHSDQGAYMLAAIFVRDDTLENWIYGHIPPHSYFGFLCFCNSVFLCVVQDQFSAQSTSRMAFYQEGEDDEDMTLMNTIMIGAWHGEGGVQLVCPSQEGGSRLIQFESPRWRPKAIQVRAHLEVQEQHVQKTTRRSHTESFWTFFIWMEMEFYRASNGTGPTSKFHRSRQESSKQVDFHNLSGCYAIVFWTVGPCIVLKPIGAHPGGHPRPNPRIFSSYRHIRVWVLFSSSFPLRNRHLHCNCDVESFCCESGPRSCSSPLW